MSIYAVYLHICLAEVVQVYLRPENLASDGASVM